MNKAGAVVLTIMAFVTLNAFATAFMFFWDLKKANKRYAEAERYYEKMFNSLTDEQRESFEEWVREQHAFHSITQAE